MRAFSKILVRTPRPAFAVSPFSSVAQQEFVTRYPHLPDPKKFDIPPPVVPIVSPKTANSKQELALKVNEVVKKYQMHSLDVGSSQVQKKIRSLAKHFSTHKKDKSGLRGLMAMVSKRKALMKHLKKNNFEEYKRVVIEMDLIKEAANISKFRS